MLAYILAIAVGLASLSLYLSAFFLPELHRKDDFLWSGVGLFYALVLWVCAGSVTGGVLLGQSAAVTLVICFGWQTLRLRRAIAHPDEKTDISGFSLVSWVQNRFKKKSPSPVPSVSETPEEEKLTPQPENEVTPEPETETTLEQTPVISQLETSEESDVTPEPEIETTTEQTPVISQVEPPEATEVTPEPETETTTEPTSEETDDSVEPETETIELETNVTSEVNSEEETEMTPEPETETTETKKQGFSFKSLFGLGKSKSQPTTQPPEKISTDPDLEDSNWDDDEEEEDSSDIEPFTPSLVEETEVIKSESGIETTEVTEEDLIDKETSEISENLQEYVAEFEPYLADDEAETLVEDYKPKTETAPSQTTEKEEEEE
ncbi:Ycf66 family protein [Cyanothece sp. BG0011]|uniref:Ycf66 family protein n=1 Tax=Cyanothece sp. BG0011 TaxID=2082950 RepID=UPI0018E58D4F|nr:Ycf66 family protein [Cyanothece sp. BG0011]